MKKSCQDIYKDLLLGYKEIVEFERDSSNGKKIFYDTINFNCDKKNRF